MWYQILSFLVTTIFVKRFHEGSGGCGRRVEWHQNFSRNGTRISEEQNS